MGEIQRAELGSSQSPGKGFPQLLQVIGSYRLRRTALATVALLGFLTAIGATTGAIEGHPDAGVVIDASGRVENVSRTGFAWRDGIRPGQRVLSSSPSDADGGWALTVEGSAGPIVSREAPVLTALRVSLPFALIGLAAGSLAIAFLRLNRDWVLPSACLALAGASVPLFLANQSLAAPVLVLGALVPGLGLAWRLRGRRALAATLAGSSAVLVAVWYETYSTGSPADTFELARRGLALGGTGLLMADRAMQSRSTDVAPLKAVWVVGVGVLISVGLALVYFAGFPAPIIAIVIVLGLLVAQPLRSLLGRRLELALMADLRQHVTADVVEEERGRLARELHDAPLQDLSAVIRRLELVPGAREETSTLLAIADQLRSVAIDLHPPMLDDLGLGAALDFLGEQVQAEETAVVVELEDYTSLDRSSRPPAAIEFALYQIAREAVTNALRHAQAREVRIAGRIAHDSIDLAITDDGIGLKGDAAFRARGRGRLGLASMRRRAQAIGAELAIDGTDAGTRISVTWRE